MDKINRQPDEDFLKYEKNLLNVIDIANNNTVRFEYYSERYYHYQPFWFETLNMSKGRKLKDGPERAISQDIVWNGDASNISPGKNSIEGYSELLGYEKIGDEVNLKQIYDYCIQRLSSELKTNESTCWYGFDINDKITYEKIIHHGAVSEAYYQYNPGEILEYRLWQSWDRKEFKGWRINVVIKYVYSNGKLMKTKNYFEQIDDWKLSHIEFEYTDRTLNSACYYNFDNTNVAASKILYNYDEAKLFSIQWQSGEYIYIRAKRKEAQDILESIKERLIASTIEKINKIVITRNIYSVCLWYSDSQNIFNPNISIGYEDNRQNVIKKHGKSLWNELVYSPVELPEECHLGQCIEMSSKETATLNAFVKAKNRLYIKAASILKEAVNVLNSKKDEYLKKNVLTKDFIVYIAAEDCDEEINEYMKFEITF